MVVLDTAALSTAVDARPLLKMADAVVLVIEAGKTKHEDVLRLVRDASFPVEKLAGIVLNKVET
jgi:Mrp family chromosome partitioning ATPase